MFERVDVDRRALWTRVGAFSGGNQQKIAIAKWLLAESRVLLLYDPTRGIDVGTKNELYRLIRAYADAGGAILLLNPVADQQRLVNPLGFKALTYRVDPEAAKSKSFFYCDTPCMFSLPIRKSMTPAFNKLCMAKRPSTRFVPSSEGNRIQFEDRERLDEIGHIVVDMGIGDADAWNLGARGSSIVFEP